MNLSDYQKRAAETALYPHVGHNITYPTLGLAGEAGEVANKVKKILRDREGNMDERIKEDLKGELGDVLWYIAALASELNLSLEEIAASNLEKLKSRKERGVLRGEGDER